MADVSAWRVALFCLSLAALEGCGKKGPLYLPDATGEVVTRPAATPPAPEGAEAPNSAQTADSQPAAPAPAPEVSAPETQDTPKKDKGASPPPPPKN
jgi:predicted small lipoprotein YifL